MGQQDIKTYGDVARFMDDNFGASHKNDSNYRAVVRLAEYVFENFVLVVGNTLPSDNYNSPYAAYQLTEIMNKIILSSKGEMPLRVPDELIVDFNDVSSAPFRLVNQNGCISLIVLQQRTPYQKSVNCKRLDSEIRKISRCEI